MDISIWCVFVAFLLIYLTRLPVVIASRRQEGYLEIGNPREQQARLTGVGSRAQAAHQNTSPQHDGKKETRHVMIFLQTHGVSLR